MVSKAVPRRSAASCSKLSKKSLQVSSAQRAALKSLGLGLGLG